MTVQETPHPGPLESAAPEGLRARWKCLVTRDYPQTAAAKDNFWRRCQRPTDRSRASEDTFKRTKRRALSRSGCHGEGKRAFEKPIPGWRCLSPRKNHASWNTC